MTLTIMAVTDIHVGRDEPIDGRKKKLSGLALPLINSFVEQANTRIHPDFVIQLGDLIQDEDPDADRQNFLSALSGFRSLNMPTYHVVGNHCQQHLDQESLRSMFGYPELYYSFDFGEFHFVVLFSTSVDHKDIQIDQIQRNWLYRDLCQTTRPTVVFLHHLLYEPDLSKNFWFADYPDYTLVKQRQEIRQILKESGKVLAVFNGHIHQNQLTIVDSIPYVSIQSLVENVAPDPDELCSESFAVITISTEAVRVEVLGNDPASYILVTPPLPGLSRVTSSCKS